MISTIKFEIENDQIQFCRVVNLDWSRGVELSFSQNISRPRLYFIRRIAFCNFFFYHVFRMSQTPVFAILVLMCLVINSLDASPISKVTIASLFQNLC